MQTKSEKRRYNRMRYWRKRNAIRKQQRAYWKRCPLSVRERKLKYQHDHLPETYEKRRGYALKAKYNLTFEQYRQMLKAQGGRCAICGEKNKHCYALAVDHDHVTGRIRKLLCNSCNAILGHAKDRISILRRCIDYLKENPQ